MVLRATVCLGHKNKKYQRCDLHHTTKYGNTDSKLCQFLNGRCNAHYLILRILKKQAPGSVNCNPDAFELRALKDVTPWDLISASALGKVPAGVAAGMGLCVLSSGVLLHDLISHHFIFKEGGDEQQFFSFDIFNVCRANGVLTGIKHQCFLPV